MSGQDHAPTEGAVKTTAGGGPKPGASLAIQPHQDDPEVRRKYRPYLLGEGHAANDWISELELNTVMEMVVGQERPRILVLYGSVRRRYVCREEHVASSGTPILRFTWLHIFASSCQWQE